MFNDTSNLPTLKEIEEKLFQEFQVYYQSAMLSILEELDKWLMDNRDFARFENREMQDCTLGTMFGAITIKRRRYLDRETGDRVALLDQYLQFSGGDALSPFLTELAVEWAARGPSYRDTRDRFCDLLGYQPMSHEKIRQEVLKLEPKEVETMENDRQKVDALFLEVDGLFVSKQSSTRKNREVKLGIAHEGWEKRHPSSREHVLKDKTYWHTLESGETFWETFSRHLYEKYEITEDTPVVINGDAAPWIPAGVEYFQNAIYTYDRYHLKKWIKQALSQRSKQERRRAYLAADANDPVALAAAIAEAEKAETDEEKKDEIGDLRLFVLDNQEALRDYREILQEKGVDTTGMRPMGAAESNMNLFSRRLKKMGYSWSAEGLQGMVSAMIHRFEGSLQEAVRNASTGIEPKKKEIKYPSFATLLTEKTRQVTGAILGRMPAIYSSDRNKPYVMALRGLGGI